MNLRSSPTDSAVATEEPASDCEYKCDACDYVTNLRKSMVRHSDVHKRREDAHKKCPQCPSLFHSHYQVNAHLLTAHRDASIKCTKCDLKFRIESKLNVHMIIHHGAKGFVCTICNHVSSLRSTLQSHMVSHSNDRPHKCPQCEYSSKKRDTLKEHMKTHLTKWRRDIKAKSVCIYCSSRLASIGELRRHVMQVHPEKRPHKCDQCEFSAETIPILRFHEITHKTSEDDKIHQCSKCDYKSHNIAWFKRHARYSHLKTEELPFQCEHCEYGTNSKCKLQRHQSTHKGQPATDLKCFICDATFKWKTVLARHIRGHKQTTIECKLCGAQLSARQGGGILLTHMYNRHSDEKIFACSYEGCAELFKHRATKIAHEIRMHKAIAEFRCQLCTKGYYAEYLLRMHMVSHQTTREARCDQCGYCGKTAAALMMHITYTHNNIKPRRRGAQPKTIGCPSCEHLFATNHSLGRHMSKEHCLKLIVCCPFGDCSAVITEAEQGAHVRKVHCGKGEEMCNRCFAIFRDRAEFRGHECGEKNTRMYECKSCRWSTNKRSMLRKHLLACKSNES